MELQNSKLKRIGETEINLHGGKENSAGGGGFVLVSVSLAANRRKDGSEWRLKSSS